MRSDCLIIGVEALSRETVQTCCVQNNPCSFEERTGRKEVIPENQNGREESFLVEMGDRERLHSCRWERSGRRGVKDTEIAEEVQANKERPLRL